VDLNRSSQFGLQPNRNALRFTLSGVSGELQLKTKILGGCPMKRHTAIAFATLALCGPCVAAEQQNTAVIQAGQLFDGKSDRLLSD
jgi:hypothetical protein